MIKCRFLEVTLTVAKVPCCGISVKMSLCPVSGIFLQLCIEKDVNNDVSLAKASMEMANPVNV